ncbi:MAG: hypothetical protein KDE30_06025, partial [Novosphingobium sp.]|nr:hypothetical protein [Novosphingobium sp.]
MRDPVSLRGIGAAFGASLAIKPHGASGWRNFSSRDGRWDEQFGYRGGQCHSRKQQSKNDGTSRE